MNILALETSTEACSVALLSGGKVYSRYQHAPRLQTELLIPMMNQVLLEAGIELKDINFLAYGRGPGAFTGIRIAAAAIQAIAYAHDLMVIPVSSLQVTAQGAFRKFGEEHAIAAFDARMNEVYVATYSKLNGVMLPSGNECLLLPSTLVIEKQEPHCLIGNGSAFCSDVLKQQMTITQIYSNEFPEAEDIIPLALLAIENGLAVAPDLALPVYLRDEVWKKLPGR